MDEFVKRNFSFHDLRTRKSGQFRFADVHLEMNEDMSLKEVHAICDEIESAIENKISNMDINIHVEPYNKASIEQKEE
jgi:divalent metal cation (Fe/Co/Zn/Cd) transporter